MALNTLKAKNFDSCVSKSERKAISELEKRTTERCPELMREGKFFRYCAKNAEITANSMYPRKLGILELKHYCMANMNTCHYHRSGLKK